MASSFVATLSERHRPALLGSSIGHPKGTRGTLGPFVRMPNGKAAFLSSASILSPAGARTGDHIHQPSPRDDHTLTGATRIGILTTMVNSLQTDRANVADAAVVELLDPDDVLGNVIPQGCPDAGVRIASVAQVDESLLNSEVACIGRSSGFSVGRIAAISAETFARTEQQRYAFKKCLEVHGDNGTFSLPGDGGALVYTRADHRAVGLLFAGTKPDAEGRTRGFVTPLEDILKLFEISLL